MVVGSNPIFDVLGSMNGGEVHGRAFESLTLIRSVQSSTLCFKDTYSKEETDWKIFFFSSAVKDWKSLLHMTMTTRLRPHKKSGFSDSWEKIFKQLFL
jgi:hypothetical protein